MSPAMRLTSPGIRAIMKQAPRRTGNDVDAAATLAIAARPID